MITEGHIREAMEGLADLAPAPDRLRAAIHGAVRTHRQRRALLLSGASAAAVAAVGVPAALLLRDRRAGPPVVHNLPSPAPEPTGAGNLRVPLRLRPAWLPEGLVELSREARHGEPAQVRIWASPAAIEAIRAQDSERLVRETTVILHIRRERTPAQPSSWPPESPPPPPQTRAAPETAVAGRPAWLNVPPHSSRPAQLEWYLDDGLLATIHIAGIADSGKTALQIAEALVPDAVGGCETSLRFGWLPPAASQTWDIEVYGYSDGRWTQSLRALPSVNTGPEPVWARYGTSLDMIGLRRVEGEPTTLRGRPGHARAAAGYGEATVELDGGRWLQVLCYPHGDDPVELDVAIRVANELRIGPDPYLGWIGHR